MIAEFQKNPENPPAAFAVVDDVGLLLAYARTDGSRPIISRNATKKAYTAALRGMTTETFFEELNHRGWRVGDMGDPMLIAVPGGVPVIDPSDGAVLGRRGRRRPSPRLRRRRHCRGRRQGHRLFANAHQARLIPTPAQALPPTVRSKGLRRRRLIFILHKIER